MNILSSYADVNKWLTKFIHNKPKSGTYKLDNIRHFMSLLGNPQENYKVIHIAGTSGKTSTCYYMASLLNTAGYKVGLSVSPHVDEINERAQINCMPLSEEEYCAEISEFKILVESSEIKLTYFEVLVAFAYWLFDKKKMEYVVIEVGLGGLLDGTNIISNESKVSVITDIGYDHMEILGYHIEEIAFQKAGIIQNHNRVFMYDQMPEVMNVVRKVCSDKKSYLCTIPPDSHQNIISSHLTELPLFQQRNFILALSIFENLFPEYNSESDKFISRALNIYIPGRMEIIQFNNKSLIIDGSHNYQKIHALVESTQKKYKTHKNTILLSIGSNKNESIGPIMHELKKLSDSIILTSFSNYQDEIKTSINPNDLISQCKEAGFSSVVVEPDPDKAFDIAIKDIKSEVLVVTGSYYLLFHIRPIVMGKSN